MAEAEGTEKVGPDIKKKGKMLEGKNKWYIIGGLGIVAVLVFYFVSRSNSASSGGTTATTGGAMDPATQAALQSALQGQGAAGYAYQASTGPQGVAGPPGATGKPGKRGKPGKPGKPGHHVPHRPPPHKRVGHTVFHTVRPGETLSGIARDNNVAGGYTTLYHMNRGVIGSNPNVIHPGQRLKI
jgi:nucleoid-associated protein YgaU